MVSEDSKIKSIQPELSQVWSGERCLPGAMCCDKELEGLVPKVGWEGRAVKWGRGRAVMLALPARDEGIINSSPTPLIPGAAQSTPANPCHSSPAGLPQSFPVAGTQARGFG